MSKKAETEGVIYEVLRNRGLLYANQFDTDCIVVMRPAFLATLRVTPSGEVTVVSSAGNYGGTTDRLIYAVQNALRDVEVRNDEQRNDANV